MTYTVTNIPGSFVYYDISDDGLTAVATTDSYAVVAFDLSVLGTISVKQEIVASGAGRCGISGDASRIAIYIYPNVDIYVLTSGAYVLEQTLTPHPSFTITNAIEFNDNQPNIHLSTDGDRILVNGKVYHSLYSSSHAVAVAVRVGSTWAYEALLNVDESVGGVENFDFATMSIAFSGDGATAAITYSKYGLPNYDRQYVSIWHRTGSSWSMTQDLGYGYDPVNSVLMDNYFGWFLAINHSGTILAVLAIDELIDVDVSVARCSNVYKYTGSSGIFSGSNQLFSDEQRAVQSSINRYPASWMAMNNAGSIVISEAVEGGPIYTPDSYEDGNAYYFDGGAKFYHPNQEYDYTGKPLKNLFPVAYARNADAILFKSSGDGLYLFSTVSGSTPVALGFWSQLIGTRQEPTN